MNERQIEAAARAAHEASRAYCEVIGDSSQVEWDHAPDWQKTSIINGVKGVLAGNTPEQSHERWLAMKRATGWKYGPVKDPEKKEHPCFMPYDELSPEQRAKDHIFVGVVSAVIAALKWDRDMLGLEQKVEKLEQTAEQLLEKDRLEVKRFLRDCAIAFASTNTMLGELAAAETRKGLGRDEAARSLVADWSALWNEIQDAVRGATTERPAL
jgi:hypothetical protein